MRRPGPLLTQFLTTIVIGGVAIGACVAALLPGTSVFAKSITYQSDAVGKLRSLAQRSTIYDASLNQIGVLGTQNRQYVKLEAVPKILQNAVISVEDKTFWTNDGIDLNGVFRAAVRNVSSGQVVQGGSTITQQLVKERLLNSKRDVHRKVKEIILALRLNQKFSKRQILEQYLNTVYFGQGSYGVEAAAERFFVVADPTSPFGGVRGTDLAHISIGQAALLAGLINNPEGNNPFANPRGARIRRAVALSRMVTEGYITTADEAKGNAEPLPTIKPQPDLRPTNAWVAEVQQRLFTDPLYAVLGKTVKERKDAVLKGGLKIVATEDQHLQSLAQNAVNNDLTSPAGFTGSMVAIDPKTGEVKAMVGGPGFQNSQFNIATLYPGRQAGSTWKTITLAAALESGFSPNDIVDGTSPCQFPVWGRTQNAEGGGGAMSLRAATAGSVNCAFARTELAVGFPKLIDTAHKLGITQSTLKPILTLTLGTVESTALEMATVSATLADEGVHHSPVFVSKIIGPDGTVIFDDKTIQGTQVISKESADCETDLLKGVITGGTGTNAALNGRDAAGKTGTTDNLSDANFLEFTPQLADFVWHGNPTGRIPGAGFGGQAAAAASRDFMNPALQGQPALPLPDPGPACARPGGLISENGRVANGAGLFPSGGGGGGGGGTPAPTTPPPTVVITPPPTPPPATQPPTPTTTVTPPSS
ncbi:MAG TPA: transglycosylase domain-containing protein [Acidimicrobiia bacterium]|nr:transglycosylase domain-containing protein [Acidimicrobiia bacterium]